MSNASFQSFYHSNPLYSFKQKKIQKSTVSIYDRVAKNWILSGLDKKPMNSFHFVWEPRERLVYIKTQFSFFVGKNV